MRPLLRRVVESDRLLVALWAGMALAAVSLVSLIFVTSRGGDRKPPEDVETSPKVTATAAFVVPQLPADCLFTSNFGPGASLLRVNVPTPIVVSAPGCAAGTWEREPVEHLAAELRIDLDAPDGPAQLLVPLAATRDADGLRWTGTVTFPLAGFWRPDLHVDGQSGMLQDSWRVAASAGLDTRPGLPLPAIEYELTVLNVDRPGEPARWPALESQGMAWVPGAKPGEAARVVWVQAREGRDWVVAGDPTTGAVTALFEVELPVSLFGAPDGRAFVVIDRLYDAPKRIRFYDAERSKLIDVAASRLDPGPVSWAPDSSVVLIAGDRTLMLASDGGPIRLDVELPFERVAWSPDSTWAIAALRELPTENAAPRNELVRIGVGTGTATHLLDEVAQGRVLTSPGAAVSPDGRRFALAWWDPSEPASKISVFDRDGPLPLRLEDRVVASYPAPGAPGTLQSLTSMSWTPDGTSLVVSMFAPLNGQMYPPDTSIQVIDIASKSVRLVVAPRDGHYAYGPMWVSSDGRALFKQWSSCVGCDGGRSGIDVIDLADGAIVRTIEDSVALGTVDGVRYLLSSPEGLLSVRGLEPPRVLMSAKWRGSTWFSVQPSPDSNRLAVAQAAGRTSPVIAVAPDGSAQTVLGYVRPEASVVGLRDASTAFVLDYEAGWAWSSFADGAVTPLPQQGEARPEAALETAVAVSPDRSVAAYWVPGPSKPEVTLQLLELRTGAVTSSVATSSQMKGMYLAMSVDGKRVLFPDGDALVAVDVLTRSTVRIPLRRLGHPAGIGIVSSATYGPGGTFEVVAGDKLWRIDPASGDARVVTDRQPSPGGWRSSVQLSRSPDGQRLVALTAFGLFELQLDGSWRLASGVGLDSRGPVATSIVWSPDSRRVAYLGSEGPGVPGALGIVVVGLDGSGAYELVKQSTGHEMRVLGWLPDGRIVYAVITNGI